MMRELLARIDNNFKLKVHEVMEKGCDDSTVAALSMKQWVKVLLLVKSQSIQSILGRI